jgi:hypothetical protein
MPLAPDNNKSVAAVAWTTTAILGCFLCFLQFGMMLSLLAGRTGLRLVAPLALFAALIAGLWLAHKDRLSQRLQWAPLVLAVAIVTLSLAVSAFYYDLSWDGQWYHQAGIDHIERGETPKNMRGRSRLVRFGYSIFGRPGNQPYFIGSNATLMWPFLAHPADLYAYTYQETRVAGFGPWFSGCLLLSLALAAWLLTVHSQGRWALLLLCATILSSLLISRHLWWPRYGPQLWWLPILPIILALHPGHTRRQRMFASATLGLLLLNALIVAEVRMSWETTHSIALRRQLTEMRNSGKQYRVSTQYFTDSAGVRLHEAGINYQDLGMKKLPNGHELVSVVEHYPAATRYLADDESH